MVQEKWRFIKSITQLKWADYKVGWRWASFKKRK